MTRMDQKNPTMENHLMVGEGGKKESMNTRKLYSLKISECLNHECRFFIRMTSSPVSDDR